MRLSAEARERAERFVLTTARLLERRRYDYLFGDGSAEDVRRALEAYSNPDGGYGHALEPDGRGPGSQPVHALFAAEVLDEIGALHGETAGGFCDHLASITADDGGLPIVHPNIRDYPRPPWWGIPERYEGSLIPTANILGLLQKNNVDHPWTARAAKFCTEAVAALDADTVMPYAVMAALAFLESTPARDWAAREAKRLGELSRDRGVMMLPGADAVRFAGFAESEVFYPHDYATRPGSLATAWFSADELSWSLDRGIEAQAEDGGWPVPWGIWTPVIEFEWRPVLTLQALRTLQAYDRF